MLFSTGQSTRGIPGRLIFEKLLSRRWKRKGEKKKKNYINAMESSFPFFFPKKPRPLYLKKVRYPTSSRHHPRKEDKPFNPFILGDGYAHGGGKLRERMIKGNKGQADSHPWRGKGSGVGKTKRKERAEGEGGRLRGGGGVRHPRVRKELDLLGASQARRTECNAIRR